MRLAGFHDLVVINLTPVLLVLLHQAEKLLRSGNRIGDGVLAVDNDRCGEIGRPHCGEAQIARLFHSKLGVIRRPTQQHIWTRRSYGQLR